MTHPVVCPQLQRQHVEKASKESNKKTLFFLSLCKEKIKAGSKVSPSHRGFGCAAIIGEPTGNLYTPHNKKHCKRHIRLPNCVLLWGNSGLVGLVQAPVSAFLLVRLCALSSSASPYQRLCYQIVSSIVPCSNVCVTRGFSVWGVKVLPVGSL